MNRRAWQATVHGVTKSWMRLSTHAFACNALATIFKIPRLILILSLGFSVVTFSERTSFQLVQHYNLFLPLTLLFTSYIPSWLFLSPQYLTTPNIPNITDVIFIYCLPHPLYCFSSMRQGFWSALSPSGTKIAREGSVRRGFIQ